MRRNLRQAQLRISLLPTRQASISYALLRFRVFGRSLASLVFGAT